MYKLILFLAKEYSLAVTDDISKKMLALKGTVSAEHEWVLGSVALVGYVLSYLSSNGLLLLIA